MDNANVVDMMQFHRFLLGETSVRLERFGEAIAAAVRSGDTVLDLGTGTGILAFFACLAGARRVYAVETSAAIEIARLLARENGFVDRVVFLNRSSQEIELPEQVDVLVTDTFGTCGLRHGGLRSIIDVRDRFLKPGGSLIPTSIDVFIAAVEIPEAYQSHIEFWQQQRCGLELSAVRQLAVNNCYPVRVEQRALLADAAPIARMDLASIESVLLHGEVHLTAGRPGTLHGLCGWFAARLVDDIVLGNRPGATTTNYAQGFFPIARPVPLDEGDRVKIRITSYDSLEWRWQVDIDGHGDAVREGRARFDHSTFWGLPTSATSLRNFASDHAPRLSPRGEAEHFLLGLADGGTPIAELEQRLLQRYPGLFKTGQDVTAFVADVVSRCAWQEPLSARGRQE